MCVWGWGGGLDYHTTPARPNRGGKKMDSLRAALDASTYDDMMFCHHEIVHTFEAFHHERLLFPDGENNSQILVFF